MRLFSRFFAALIGFVALAGFSPNAVAAAITFNTALPVSKGEIIVREQVVVDRARSTDKDRSEITLLSVLVYGLTSRLALFGILPYTDRKLEMSIGDRESSGLGDVRLFARYTVYRRDSLGQTLRLAPFVGLKAPTGDSRESDSFGRLPPSIQSGSGSWDVFGGFIATYATLDWQLDSQISYQVNTRGSTFEAGDVVRADASLQYRLYPPRLSASSLGFLYGVLEVNLIHKAKNQIHGITDSNSGGTTLYLTPGLQYAAKRWIAEAAIQIPVIQNLNGTTLKRDFIFRTGFRVNF